MEMRNMGVYCQGDGEYYCNNNKDNNNDKTSKKNGRKDVNRGEEMILFYFLGP